MRLAAAMAYLIAALAQAFVLAPSHAEDAFLPGEFSRHPPVAAPMRLGLPPERWKASDADAKPRAPERDKCRRWRAMAHQLGETYAGHTLREGVLKRMCWGLVGEQAERVWDWPWAGIAKGLVLPPRSLQSIGSWQIRCGSGSMRRRCALLHTAAMPSTGDPTAAGPAIVVHFVIDMIAGRESVLWRVFVPVERRFADGLQQEAGLQSSAAAPMPPRERGHAIRYAIGTVEHSERFSTCSEAGCMMEASLRRAGDVATRLWDGHAVDIAISLPSSEQMEFKVPAKGFRAALVELMRLRREEIRAARR